MNRIIARAGLGALLVASAVVGGIACSGGSGGSSTPTPSCTGTPFTATNLGTLQTSIFSPTCALSTSCHTTGGIIPGFDLSAGHTYASTVGVSTTAYFYAGQQETFNGNKLPIVALNGSTSGSYLYLKVTGANGIYGLVMPYT